jgi:hypothetical protein
MARKKVTVKKKTGRKTLYDPLIVLPRLEALAKKGVTNIDIAKSLGITESTFYEWNDKYPEFSLSLKKYKGLADIEVENALFKTAVGFDYDENKYERVKNNKTGKYSMQLVQKTVKKVTGNATAQIFYLKNRMPDRYRDKTIHEHSGKIEMEAITFKAKRRE